MDLKGKVALVTGGSLGIGTSISLDLAQNGADVALTYRKHEKEAKAVVDKIKAMGHRAQEYKVDVSDYINVDLKGTFNFIRAVAPVFREQESGKIINITSINALRGKFGQANYSAAKAGAIGLTKAVAREMGKYSVNVNAVAPGMIETAMIKDLPDDFKEKAAAETVFNRLGQPEDIAHLVSFLSSDKAKHITGEVIKVDGGQYI